MHVAGVARRRAHLRAHRPGAGRQPARAAGLRASGKGTVRRAPSAPGIELDDEAAARAVEPLKELEHRGYHFEAADASFDLLLRKEAASYEPLFRLESFRVITEKREDGKVQTEATIKIWVDGERYVRTAEGNGPVNALDTALRDAIADLYPRLRDIELVNYKVRIIDEHKGTGAVTRVLIDSSDGERRVGHDRRLGEHHRGELGGAGRLARVRDPARATPERLDAPKLSDDRSRSRGRTSAPREEELVLEVLRSGRLSLGPMLERFEQRLRRLARRRRRGRRVERHGRAAPRRAGARAGARATRSSPVPFSFVASANCLLYEGAQAGLLRHRPGHADIDPAAAAAAVAERTAGLLPVHIFGYPADMPALEALARERGLGIVEDACEALGARRRRRDGGRRRAATSRRSPSTPTSR